jgi:hypothetical protein
VGLRRRGITGSVGGEEESSEDHILPFEGFFIVGRGIVYRDAESNDAEDTVGLFKSDDAFHHIFRFRAVGEVTLTYLYPAGSHAQIIRLTLHGEGGD